MSDPDATRVQKFAEAIQAAADRHGVTHTEDWHPEARAAIAIADAELAAQDQSWSQFHTDTTRALEAAEAEVERLRELIMQADWSVEQSQVSIAKLARQVESAEQKAADYHEEILAAHADRDEWKRRAETAEAKLAEMQEETRTLADGMAGSVWSEGKLVQSFTKPNTIQRRLVTEWTSE